MARLGRSQPFPPKFKRAQIGSATIALTGTAVGCAEADIVAGGRTIVLTLTGDTWVAAGATFDAVRQGILTGLDSNQAEAAGWDAVVKATAAVTDVVRTSASVVTITLEAFATYNIAITETITATVPASALNLAAAIVATPSFTVIAAGATADTAASWIQHGPGPQLYRAGQAA